MQSALSQFSAFFVPHLYFISTAYVATVLVLFGSDINRAVRALIKNAHFVLRTAIFVILCALGYGFVTVQGGIWLAQLLVQVDRTFLGLLIVAAFIWVGWLAERRSV
ncbi:MAG: DUF3392 family protein [Natronospirillum sp.]